MRELTRLDVHWSRLARNWEGIQKLAPQAKILPMVKANAYGHGLLPVSQYLFREMKAHTLGVATLGEAEAITQGVSDFTGVVYVFSETDLHLPARYAGKNIWPVVSNLGDLQTFLSGGAFAHLPLILKLNTGMNRLGVSKPEWEEAIKLIRASGRTSIRHLLSHYASSYIKLKASDRTHRQAEEFEEALTAFRGAGLQIEETSLANSGAIEQRFTVNHTWVRPGLMLYGPPSLEWKGEIVSSLVTHAMKVFPVKRGTPVGYGASVPAEDGLIVIVPLGYGDGFPTQASGWSFEHRGMTAKVFGRVNMDMAFLFFPSSAVGKVNVGDEIRLWDADPKNLLSFAEHMQTHAYQAMCSLSGRVPRIYRLE